MKKRSIIIAIVLVSGVLVWVAIPKDRQDSGDALSGKTKTSAAKLYEQAVKLRQSGELLEAKKIYTEIMTESPDFDQMQSVQTDLGDLNMQILFSSLQTPKTIMHEVASGDSLAKIASKYKTTIDFIKKSNNLQSDVIRAGQKLRIYNAQFNIFVDKSQNILILKDGGEVVKVYHVSTGKNNSTPIGKFKIVSKLVDPVWFTKGAVVPPESPDNVLGTRWMGFDLQGYGIHGTVDPDMIGQQVTAGCVRMKNPEVEELYSIVPMGTEVTVAD